MTQALKRLADDPAIIGTGKKDFISRAFADPAACELLYYTGDGIIMSITFEWAALTARQSCLGSAPRAPTRFISACPTRVLA